MKVQNLSVMTASNQYTQGGQSVKTNNAGVNGSAEDSKTGGKNGVVVQLSPQSQFNKMIEKIQEQIQKINENEYYDDDTKKSKIEELEKQLEELQKAKTEQANESLLGAKKKEEDGDGGKASNAEVNERTNSDGDTLNLSVDTKALIKADSRLRDLTNAHTHNVKLNGEANVQASEIKIDKGRGVNTEKKEARLDKIKENYEKTFETMGKAAKGINEAVKDMSAREKTDGRQNIAEEEKPEGPARPTEDEPEIEHKE